MGTRRVTASAAPEEKPGLWLLAPPYLLCPNNEERVQGMVAGVEDGIVGLETKAFLPAELRTQARVCEFILGEAVTESSSRPGF